MASSELDVRNSRFSLFSLLLFFLMRFFIAPVDGQNATSIVDVGLIIDLDTIVGKMSHTCMSMAIDDFYANHNYTRRIVLHTRDSKSDIIDAASAAVGMIKNVQVQAILGSQRSTQADFVIDIGNKAQVPIISQATSPFISPKETPYFIRAAQNASSQVDAIVAMVKASGWREVVLLYEDNDYGRGISPYLINALQKMSTKVPYRSIISPSATDDQILQELYHLMTMQSRVFVVHMLPPLASRLFLKAKEAGMMSQRYAWIITDVLTSLLDSLDYMVVDSMQGVLGVKPYIPRSMKLDNFTRRWRKRFHQENPETDIIELNIYGMWAYDSVMALAMAIERADIAWTIFKRPATRENLTDFAAIGTSEMGPKLLKSIQNMRFNGLSGDFHLVDGELQPLAFQIVNIIGEVGREIGFWTRENGISEKPMPSNTNYNTNKDDLLPIKWPGESNVIPKGWEMPTSERKLKIGVPIKSGFGQFIKVERDPQTNAVIPTGFCIDVFKEVMDSLPYAVPYDFIPFETPDGESDVNYDDLIYQVFLEKFDAVVGDITIVANRTNFVDFTLPFTESGVFMIVPIKADVRKNAWIFLKPLTVDLWFTIGAFFVSTGFVVWVLEHRVNKEFRGPPLNQVGMTFWFSVSTLVFAHKEKVISNLTRFVVIVLVFVVLVRTSSYTASLTSVLTVQKLEPTITNVNDLIRNAWIFMKPLTMDLWLTTGAFFVSTGFVVWVLEHRVDKYFCGPPHKKVGMISWFSFSALVFAHKEKVISILTRFVVIVWVFVVLVLTSSYTASLTSLLMVQKLEPTITNVNDLIRNGEYVGYQYGSFIAGLLENMKVDVSKFRNYSTLEEYDEALSKGSKNGGVAAIVDELPYIKLFLSKYCTKYTMIALNYKTGGFGFAFRKGSPLVPDISRMVLHVTEGDGMTRIARKWLGNEADCAEQDGAIVTSDSLTLDSFKGLFLIAGVSSSFAFTIFLFIFLNENKDILASDESIWKKLAAIATDFDEEKENSSDSSKKTSTTNEGPAMDSGNAVPPDVTPDGTQSPAISFFHDGDEFLSQDERFLTMEPQSPIHDTVIAPEITVERW